MPVVCLLDFFVIRAEIRHYVPYIRLLYGVIEHQYAFWSLSCINVEARLDVEHFLLVEVPYPQPEKLHREIQQYRR